MGADLDGAEGTLGLGVAKRQALASLILFVLSHKSVRQDVWLGLLGRIAFACQFNRPIFSVLCAAYGLFGRFVKSYNPSETRFITAACREELLLIAVLLPLAVANLRLPCDLYISSSDASPYGGAAGVAFCPTHLFEEYIRATDFKGHTMRLNENEIVT